MYLDIGMESKIGCVLSEWWSLCYDDVLRCIKQAHYKVSRDQNAKSKDCERASEWEREKEKKTEKSAREKKNK